MAPINCGSELARDSGGSVNISSNCLTAIASKLAPTMDGDRLAGAGGAQAQECFFQKPGYWKRKAEKNRPKKTGWKKYTERFLNKM
ncbi:hypothetical protein [Pseudomonas baetica]|uniref:hypothetical protein n=1 Tax=Pseudomonas baetica TaxID=674054 RepID=UPI002407339F|nr:hypothetical protein [Pseudomonas baetica]MDF9776674.1 hypothetical protein [Pseudomonas baetica]